MQVLFHCFVALETMKVLTGMLSYCDFVEEMTIIMKILQHLFLFYNHVPASSEVRLQPGLLTVRVVRTYKGTVNGLPVPHASWLGIWMLFQHLMKAVTTTNADHEQLHLGSSPESEELSHHLMALRASVERRYKSHVTSPLAVDITNLLHRAIKQERQGYSTQVNRQSMLEEWHLKGVWNNLLHFPVINSSCNMELFLSLYPVPKARY